MGENVRSEVYNIKILWIIMRQTDNMLKYMKSNLRDGETHSPALLSSVINIDATLHDVRHAPNAM